MEFAHPARGVVYESLMHINAVPSAPEFLQVHAAFHALIIEFIQLDAR